MKKTSNYSSVHKKFEAKLAMYVHCHAHRLNLALVDSVKAVQAAADFFVLLEKLYVYVSGSFVHDRWLEIQKELFPGERQRKLQRLRDTRWSCRYAACRAVRDRLHDCSFEAPERVGVR